jgi:hypothetical protein
MLASKDQPTDANPYPFFKKLMFGSDYFMPNAYGSYERFAEQMIRVFESDGLKDLADNFFVDNAKRFLNLRGFLNRHPSLTLQERAAFEAF